MGVKERKDYMPTKKKRKTPAARFVDALRAKLRAKHTRLVGELADEKQRSVSFSAQRGAATREIKRLLRLSHEAADKAATSGSEEDFAALRAALAASTAAIAQYNLYNGR